MTQEQFIKDSINALSGNTAFRNAQNRAFFYGDHVYVSKNNKCENDIIDGFGYSIAYKNMYHTQNNGWVDVKYLLPLYSKQRLFISAPSATEYIDFGCKNNCGKKPKNGDYSKNVISFETFKNCWHFNPDYASAVYQHLMYEIFPVGTCEYDCFNEGDSVKVCAPGLFCDGMVGTVVKYRTTKTGIVLPFKALECAVEFPLPDQRKSILPQVHIIPKMYLKKVNAVELPENTEQQTQTAPEGVKVEQSPAYELTACNYTFTGHMYKKIIARLEKEPDKHNLYALSIAYVLSMLKYKATECKNGDMNIYIGDDKEGELFFISLQLLEEKLNYPIARYFELAKLGPIE